VLRQFLQEVKGKKGRLEFLQNRFSCKGWASGHSTRMNHPHWMHSFKGIVTQDSLIYLRIQRDNLSCWKRSHTDKKENQIFLIYKEIQNGAVAKSYMRNAQTFPRIWGGRFSHIRLCNCSILNFLMYKENLVLFFISAGGRQVNKKIIKMLLQGIVASWTVQDFSSRRVYYVQYLHNRLFNVKQMCVFFSRQTEQPCTLATFYTEDYQKALW
jgi:hypothetical protein